MLRPDPCAGTGASTDRQWSRIISLSVSKNFGAKNNHLANAKKRPRFPYQMPFLQTGINRQSNAEDSWVIQTIRVDLCQLVFGLQIHAEFDISIGTFQILEIGQ
jgi:hypothetical protein